MARAPRKASRPSSSGTAASTDPRACNGWRLYQWAGFAQRWDALVNEVERLKAADPLTYQSHDVTKFLATVLELVTKTIPADPGHDNFRLGKTMGEEFKFWRRAKFHGRFRLFFRFNSKDKMILYVWLNDDATLRKAGARTDPYVVFKSMLEAAAPPSHWEELKTACVAFNDAP